MESKPCPQCGAMGTTDGGRLWMPVSEHDEAVADLQRQLAEAQADSAQQAEIIGRLGQQVDSLRAVVAQVKYAVDEMGDDYQAECHKDVFNAILASEPKVLAVVDGWAHGTVAVEPFVENEYRLTEKTLVIYEHDMGWDNPVTAIIIERSGE